MEEISKPSVKTLPSTHLSHISGGIAWWVIILNVTLCLVTRARKRKYKIFIFLEWESNSQPVAFTVIRSSPFVTVVSFIFKFYTHIIKLKYLFDWPHKSQELLVWIDEFLQCRQCICRGRLLGTYINSFAEAQSTCGHNYLEHLECVTATQ